MSSKNSKADSLAEKYLSDPEAAFRDVANSPISERQFKLLLRLNGFSRSDRKEAIARLRNLRK